MRRFVALQSFASGAKAANAGRDYTDKRNLAQNSGLWLAVIVLLERIAGQTTYALAIAADFSSLAGSQGNEVNGSRWAFIVMRRFAAVGTVLIAIACAGSWSQT